MSGHVLTQSKYDSFLCSFLILLGKFANLVLSLAFIEISDYQGCVHFKSVTTRALFMKING